MIYSRNNLPSLVTSHSLPATYSTVPPQVYPPSPPLLSHVVVEPNTSMEHGHQYRYCLVRSPVSCQLRGKNSIPRLTIINTAIFIRHCFNPPLNTKTQSGSSFNSPRLVSHLATTPTPKTKCSVLRPTQKLQHLFSHF